MSRWRRLETERRGANRNGTNAAATSRQQQERRITSSVVEKRGELSVAVSVNASKAWSTPIPVAITMNWRPERVR